MGLPIFITPSSPKSDDFEQQSTTQTATANSTINPSVGNTQANIPGPAAPYVGLPTGNLRLRGTIASREQLVPTPQNERPRRQAHRGPLPDPVAVVEQMVIEQQQAFARSWGVRPQPNYRDTLAQIRERQNFVMYRRAQGADEVSEEANEGGSRREVASIPRMRGEEEREAARTREAPQRERVREMAQDRERRIRWAIQHQQQVDQVSELQYWGLNLRHTWECLRYNQKDID